MQDLPKILVLRLSSMGDIILISPVFRNIKNKWQNARISVLVKPQFAEIVGKNPLVSETILFKNVFQAVSEIKKRKFTHLIDLHSTFRTHLISMLSGVPQVLRYKKDSLARRLFVHFRIPSPALQKHTLDRYLSVLDKLNVPIVHKFPQIEDWKFNLPDEKIGPDIANVCVIQTAFLGDCVLTLPLLKTIKSILKNPKITVVSRPEMAGIFKNSGQTDEIIIDEKKTSKFFFPEFLKILKLLKSRRFDMAIIPHRSLRSALLAYLARIPVRIGFDSSAGSMFLTRKIPFSWLLHDLERNLTLALPVTERVQASFPEFTQNQPDKFHLPCRPIIGVNPGSVWNTKRWLPERYAKLIMNLAQKYKTKIVIIGGKNELDWNKRIESLAGTDNCINLTGNTDMEELMAVIKKTDIFITNDSGPMHIAIAMNVPTIAIFGPTSRELGFFPYGNNNRVVEVELNCRPCALHGSKKCPRGHFLCMRLISLDRVFNAAVEMMPSILCRN